MAPETLEKGEYSQRTDLYAWGVVLYEMLAGKRLFRVQATPLRMLRPDLPGTLEQLVLRSVAMEPEQRPQNMQEVITILCGIAPQEKPEPQGPTVSVPPRGKEKPQPERVRWKRIGVPLGVAVAGLAVTWVIVQGPNPIGSRQGSEAEKESPAGATTASTVTLPSLPVPQPGDTTIEVNDHRKIAEMHLDNGEYEDAIQELQAALQLAPDNAEIQKLLSEARAAQKAEAEVLGKR